MANFQNFIFLLKVEARSILQRVELKKFNVDLARVSNARNLPLMNLRYVTPKVRGPYVVIILDWAPIIKW